MPLEEERPLLCAGINSSRGPNGEPLVCLTLDSAQIIEDEKGNLVPGLAFSTDSARELAENLLRLADEADSEAYPE